MLRKTTWRIKSTDDQVTVRVQLSRRGKETGKSHYYFADGRQQLQKYSPRHEKKIRKSYSFTVILCSGFLSGILLQALTNVLKLHLT